MLQKVEEKYKKLVNVNAIKESTVLVHLKWQKAVNDLVLAEGLFKISSDKKIKDSLNYSDNTTFFDWVIVCSYYSIFHSAQALLGVKKIKVINRLHYATLIAFAKHFIINKELEEELLFIYEDTENKAKELLEIFEEEKDKRGIFQYHRLSKNNIEPAKKSLKNAKIFLDAIQQILSKKKII